jgi:hypothetical protein
MYDSLQKYMDNFHLFIFAFDDLSYDILTKSKLDNATIISLKEFENQKLLDIKNSRTRAEYCWTCTSSVIKYVIDNFSVQSCTYLDADICFYSSPLILLKEMHETKSVLITEHRFSKLAEIYEKKRAGRFCVQFITFKNTSEGNRILDKWISQCIDWCYARFEDGKFGDQKYLDSWPDEYPGVHILQHPGGGIAPWNVSKYDFKFEDNRIIFTDKLSPVQYEVIFFHFHFVRITNEKIADLGWNRLQQSVMDGFYKPYINKILEKETFLKSTYPEYLGLSSPNVNSNLSTRLKSVFKKVTGYNMIKI